MLFIKPGPAFLSEVVGPVKVFFEIPYAKDVAEYKLYFMCNPGNAIVGKERSRK